MSTVTITRGTTLPDSASKTDFHNLIDTATGTVSGITTSDLSGSAGIVGTQLSATAAIADTQLATISTAGKVNTSALTTTSQAAGDILYNNGSGWVRLAKDAGKYLLSGASAVSWNTVSVAAVAGMTVQTVNTQTAAYATGATFITVDDSIPQITEGTEVMTLAITPTSATNKLKITVCVNGSVDYNGRLVCALFQDATANALNAASGQQSNNNNILQNVTFIYYMDAGTTSATTFRVRIGADTTGHNVYLNGQSGARIFGGVLFSSITIDEIKV